jgi:sensor domain CHASE-containing protein
VPASSVRFVAEFRRRAVVPMVAIMVVAFALAAGLLYQIAREQDRRSIEQSTRSVAAAISDRKKTLAKTLKDYSAWGAAYQNLHAKFDPNWAYEQENVGASLYKSYGYEYVFLLDPKNETIYAVVDGEVSHATFDGTLAGGGAVLVARARLAGPNETVVETGVLGSEQDPVLVSSRGRLRCSSSANGSRLPNCRRRARSCSFPTSAQAPTRRVRSTFQIYS